MAKDWPHSATATRATLLRAVLCYSICFLQSCAAMPGQGIVAYNPALYPGILCVESRVLVELAPGLRPLERDEIWRKHDLRPTFSWVDEGSGWNYYELEMQHPSLRRSVEAILRGAIPRRATVQECVESLRSDHRVNWAAPDALVLEWAAASSSKATSPLDHNTQPGVSFVGPGGAAQHGGAEAWAGLTAVERLSAPPMPDFEYYWRCSALGTTIAWPPVLSSSATFRSECQVVYGNGMAEALAAYEAAGQPHLDPVTVAVMDTGIYLNHPDLVGRLHEKAVDSNYRNYQVSDSALRPVPDEEVLDRAKAGMAGFPRVAVKDRPAAHGTCVAGIVARCTRGFKSVDAKDAVNILPISVKSEKVYALVGAKIKSPISAFIKSIACLSQEFPTGRGARGHQGVSGNENVRVVSLSASIPRSMFSGREWRVVEPVVSKAEGAIRQDLLHNDRVYVIAAGNERTGEPNRPGTLDCVIAVAAAMPYGPQAWDTASRREGSNLGLKCVSAPGYGIITSTLFACPNLAYLPENEIPTPQAGWSTPPRVTVWDKQTNRFCATSSATPQVSALAALAIAVSPQRTYDETIKLVEGAAGQQRIKGDWGEARGLVDYAKVLHWSKAE